MCYEEHKTYAGCHCEYKAWSKCGIAAAHSIAEQHRNSRAVEEGRSFDVRHTPSPCVKRVDYNSQNYTWACPNCRKGKDPLEPGGVGEGKVMPGKVGRRIIREWDGTYGTPENHA